jgi:hypothetical protein
MKVSGSLAGEAGKLEFSSDGEDIFNGYFDVERFQCELKSAAQFLQILIDIRLVALPEFSGDVQVDLDMRPGNSSRSTNFTILDQTVATRRRYQMRSAAVTMDDTSDEPAKQFQLPLRIENGPLILLIDRRADVNHFAISFIQDDYEFDFSCSASSESREFRMALLNKLD